MYLCTKCWWWEWFEPCVYDKIEEYKHAANYRGF